MRARNAAPAKEIVNVVAGPEAIKRVNHSERRSANEMGFLLADLNFKSIYTNHAAIQILNYPRESQATANWTAFVQERIRSILHAGRFTTQLPPASFFSGRRRYVCRPFLLESLERPPVVAVLFERRSRDPVDLSEVSRRFHLSRRECETVQHLIQGLTTKEVAQHMSVSPNTIKQFVRLIMTKMGVTTRSGIIGKFVGG